MRSVFIIGAGASNEIGMPIGTDLRNNIIDILTKVKNHRTSRVLGGNKSSLDMELPDHIKAARDAILEYKRYSIKEVDKSIFNLDEIIISLELTSSIDNLLYDFRDVPEIQAIGKIAIVSAILRAESDCALGKTSNNHKIKPTLEGTWYYSLFLELNKQANLNTFIRRLSNVYFIIFNYDRTLEYYFYNSIRRFYKTTADETADIINNMNIYHPYRQVGFLEFQREEIKTEFGFIDIDNIYAISSLIKTFMLDNFNDDEDYKKARSFLYEAEKIFLLGFAFYPQNIDLLFPNKIKNSMKDDREIIISLSNSNYYGTFYKISKINQGDIVNRIKAKNERISSFFTFEGKCVDFFDEFANIISFC